MKWSKEDRAYLRSLLKEYLKMVPDGIIHVRFAMPAHHAVNFHCRLKHICSLKQAIC